MIVHVYGPPREEIDRLKAVILSRGWGIVGCPLVVAEGPTEQEKAEYEAFHSKHGQPIEHGTFAIKVVSD